MGTKFQVFVFFFPKGKKIQELDGGDVCTTM